jgi:hypothetical protein
VIPTRSRHVIWILIFAFASLVSVPFSVQAAIYTTWNYDVPNGIVTRTEPNGIAIAYHYNAVNRLSKVVIDTGGTPSELNYYYDDLTDQLERQTYPGGGQLYSYDDFDRQETVSAFGALLHFSYNYQDRVTWIIYTGSKGAVCYEYDPDGRITRVGRV